MLQKITTLLKKRRIRRDAQSILDSGAGIFSRAWKIYPPLDVFARRRLAATIHDWLTAQLPRTATPYGFSHYELVIALAHITDVKQAVLWQTNLPPFERLESLASLAQARELVAALPYEQHPTANQVAVYLLSVGDMLKFLSADSPRAPQQKIRNEL